MINQRVVSEYGLDINFNDPSEYQPQYEPISEDEIDPSQLPKKIKKKKEKQIKINV